MVKMEAFEGIAMFKGRTGSRDLQGLRCGGLGIGVCARKRRREFSWARASRLFFSKRKTDRDQSLMACVD